MINDNILGKWFCGSSSSNISKNFTSESKKQHTSSDKTHRHKHMKPPLKFLLTLPCSRCVHHLSRHTLRVHIHVHIHIHVHKDIHKHIHIHMPMAMPRHRHRDTDTETQRLIDTQTHGDTHRHTRDTRDTRDTETQCWMMILIQMFYLSPTRGHQTQHSTTRR